jgi:hypothetical protein
MGRSSYWVGHGIMSIWGFLANSQWVRHRVEPASGPRESEKERAMCILEWQSIPYPLPHLTFFGGSLALATTSLTLKYNEICLDWREIALFFVFLGLMRCESYNANKFNIMFHVCSLVVMSEFPLNLKLQQERIKTCNSKPNSLLKKLFKGSWRCPAFLKNQNGKLPEPSNLPINWKQMKNLWKPNASQKRVFWREMKGIWEK